MFPIPIQSGQTVYISFSAEITQQTSESLLGTLAELIRAKVSTVYLLLSTPGGSVMSGLTLYNIIRAMPFKLITHNVGNVDSIGIVLFLAGEERYSSANTTFMFHGVGFDITQSTRFEEKLLRERLDSLQADQNRIAGVVETRTKLKLDEIRKLFLEATTRDPSYALDSGIIHDIRDVQIPNGATFIQLVFKR